MNKEIEELLNKLEYASGGMSGLYPSEDTVKNLVSYIEQLEKGKKELEERYNLIYKISEERKNKWLSLNEENEILFNTLKKYKLECESNGKIIHQLQNNRDKAIEYINKTVFNEKGYINFCYELENILKGDSDE